jgi:hypothetical protein
MIRYSSAPDRTARWRERALDKGLHIGATRASDTVPPQHPDKGLHIGATRASDTVPPQHPRSLSRSAEVKFS